MGNLFVRIDDRLIHGQIVTAWSSTLKINKIVAVDETLANNQMLKSIMQMAAPKEYEPEIVGVEDAKRILAETKDKNVLLITRQCRNLKPFVEDLKDAKHINLGNISKQDGTAVVFQSGAGCTLSLTQEDYDTLLKAREFGVEIFSQRVPTEKQHTWEELEASK